MKIIGGEFGGRLLVTPAGSATRPSASRVREGVASALDARGLLAGARVLDLFAGSGALGFEALSRGAAFLVAVDASPRAVRSIDQNAAALSVSARVRVVKADLWARPVAIATRLARGEGAPFALAFVDAPYAHQARVPDLLARLAAGGVFAPGATVVVEHTATASPTWPATLTARQMYRYGDTAVTLLEVASGTPTR